MDDWMEGTWNSIIDERKFIYSSQIWDVIEGMSSQITLRRGKESKNDHKLSVRFLEL